MNNYDDIINLPYNKSKKRPNMSLEARSFQFAPFSALAGYEDKIVETARLTDKKIEIDDSLMEILNNKLIIIKEHIDEKPLITFTYFIKDKNKSGGSYETLTGNVRKIDEVNKEVIFADKSKIYFDDILDINGEIFNDNIIE